MAPPVRKSMSALRLDDRHSIVHERHGIGSLHCKLGGHLHTGGYPVASDATTYITVQVLRLDSRGRTSSAANLLGAAAPDRSADAAARVATGVPGPAHGVAAYRPADPAAVRASCRRVAVVQWVIHAGESFGAAEASDPATGHGCGGSAPDAVADTLPPLSPRPELLLAAFRAAPRAGRTGVGTADQGKHSGPQAAQHRPEHRPAGTTRREGPGDDVEPLSVHAAPPCAPLSDAPLASGLQGAPAL